MRVPRAGLLLGLGLVMAFSAASPANAAPQTPPARMSEFTNARAVDAAVKQAETLASAPRDAVSQLEALAQYKDFGDQLASATCSGPSTFQGNEDLASCTFGDLKAKNTLVLTGDSRAPRCGLTRSTP